METRLFSVKRVSFFHQCLLGGLLSVAMMSCAANTPKDESTGQYLDSSVLTAQVKKELLADPEVKSLPISVTSFKGRVQLSGFVDTRAQEQRAVNIAKSIKGVEQVEDKLSVK